MAESVGVIAQGKGKLVAMEGIIEEMRRAMRAMDQAVEVMEQVGWAKANEKCQEAWRNAHLSFLETEQLGRRLVSTVLDLESRLIASIFNLETQVHSTTLTLILSP